MYLTRQLSDKSTQDAREILKTIIIKTKNTGILQTDDIKGEFAHSKATQPVALTPAPYLDRLPSSGKGDTSAEVNDEPKKEERDNKIPNSTAKCDTRQYQAANAISLNTIAGCLKPKHFLGR